MSVSSDDAVGGWAAMRPGWRNYADLLVMSPLALLVGASLSFGLMPFLMAALAFALMFFLYLFMGAIAIVAYVLERRWWSALRAIFKAAIFICLLFTSFEVRDYTHLALGFPSYMVEIVRAGGEGPIRFRWGSYGGATSGLCDETLVYDPTDALAADIGQVRDASHGIATTVRHLVGPFYVETRFDR